ncbi:hypothetical protein ADIAL_1065 [Alkalibacterium sp. AK22]|uniref:general stress protein n=1 Tax=Alkalibacterium sp. AK22 TaxID=1229520 RepID=UPI0004485FAF|nr:general stress protein [Alkalibacterium sp. AK22]EXJ23453.1 hypothetical protein ADIAL_1065 [Alkalibacterium sp. AK22]
MNKNQTVIGSYPTEKEAELVVRRLLSEGHSKEELIIFTNQAKSQNLDNPENIDVASSDMSGTHIDQEDDKSFWESLKDAFRIRDDAYYERPNYVVEDDLLHMYREDLEKGHVIVAVEKPDSSSAQEEGQKGDISKTEQTAADSKTLDTLGTTAGFPNEGSVQGMGDGGQPPMEPASNDGTPPELEDTHGEADADAATKDRLDQNRSEGLDS